MKRYTLKTFYQAKQLEIFTHRTPVKLLDILGQDKFSSTGIDSFGQELIHPNRIIIVDNQLNRVFEGTPADARMFIKAL